PGPHAMPRPYAMSRVVNMGHHLRLSDIQGAVGLAQLSKLDLLLKTRLYWAGRYDSALKEADELILPSVPRKSCHTYQSYVVRLRRGGKKKRNKVMDYLAGRGIWTRPGTHAVHRLEVYRNKYKIRPGEFPNATKGEDETIALPLYHSMHEKNFRCVIKAVKDAFLHTK
ncbi:MAG: DegT/DnrJ/EryC1/StrS family aminotransferase, partial [Candidatus Omnitrophica bacterium]|nr:DegT/DnrJ/EryC1/StrS family aminotransferase [Candidatus Omnitrophota bacterium]